MGGGYLGLLTAWEGHVQRAPAHRACGRLGVVCNCLSSDLPRIRLQPTDKVSSQMHMAGAGLCLCRPVWTH